MAWSWEIEDLSLAVRFLRALRGWTQTELARKSGWDKSRLSLMESGKHRPERADLQRLAKAVELPFFLLEACLPLLRLLRLALGRDIEAPAGAGTDVARMAEDTADEIAATTRITITEALLSGCVTYTKSRSDRDIAVQIRGRRIDEEENHGIPRRPRPVGSSDLDS